MSELPTTTQYRVLDHGYVHYIDHMGGDEDIVAAARMSTGRGFVSWEPYQRCEKCVLVQPTDGRLASGALEGAACSPHEWKKFPRGDLGMLEFMYSHQHMTPFEFGVLHIEVQAPLFVFREWMRHRMQSYSEASARYTQMPNEHYVPDVERFRPKRTGNKQESSRLKTMVQVTRDEELSATFADFNAVRDHAALEQHVLYQHYEEMLEIGVPKEVARINTPVSRYSKMRATTDLRNWLAFLTLRDAPSAQWEIQQFARAVGQIVQQLWPRTYALWEEHTKYAVSLSRSERELFTRWNDTHDKARSGVPEVDALVDKIENF